MMVERPTRRRWGHVVRVAALVLIVLAGQLVVLPHAAAHAELRQSSPRVGSVVGGEFHSIALQFSGLDTEAPFRAELVDPAGNPIGGTAVREEQRIVIPIEPLDVPGVYTVTYTTTGVDGDLVSDLFTFRYDPAADEPEGITVEITTVERLGWFGYALLLAFAGVLGFLVHRVGQAWKQHRQASTHSATIDDVAASDDATTPPERQIETGEIDAAAAPADR